MSLSLRIILIVTSALILLAVVLAVVSIGDLRGASERHLEVYLSLGLDHYLQQYPQRLSGLLAQHGLDSVDSFVLSYQADAIEAAESSDLRMGAEILVVAMPNGETLVPRGIDAASIGPARSISDHISEHIGSGNLDEGVIHFDSAMQTYYVFSVFEPWEWIVAAVAPYDIVRNETRSVMARSVLITAAIALIAALGILIVLRVSFVAPVLRIAVAARKVPSGSGIALSETCRTDELGALARDIVSAGETIEKAHQELRETNQSLERTVEARTAELAQALNRQKTLVREVHHRVKNNMNVVHSLLELQKTGSIVPGMADVLSEIQRRIASMTLIHEQLYRGDGGLPHIDSAVYLETLLDQLRRSLLTDDRNVTIESEIDRVVLTQEVAMPCGLIINELVSNALKYAFVGRSSGRVVVRFQSTDSGQSILSVGDDGVGLTDEASADTKRSTGIGRQLVEAMAVQLDGSVSTISDKGVTVTLIFPHQREIEVERDDGLSKIAVGDTGVRGGVTRSQ